MPRRKRYLPRSQGKDQLLPKGARGMLFASVVEKRDTTRTSVTKGTKLTASSVGARDTSKRLAGRLQHLSREQDQTPGTMAEIGAEVGARPGGRRRNTMVRGREQQLQKGTIQQELDKSAMLDTLTRNLMNRGVEDPYQVHQTQDQTDRLSRHTESNVGLDKWRQRFGVLEKLIP